MWLQRVRPGHVLTLDSNVGNKIAVFVLQSLGCDVAALNTVQFSLLLSVHRARAQADARKATIPATGSGRAARSRPRRSRTCTMA